MQKITLGIDIGGTNTAFGIVTSQGKILFEQQTHTRSYETPQLLANFIYDTLHKLSYVEKLSGIGIGTPNGNFYTGNMEYAPNVHWKGVVPLQKIFTSTFRVPTIITNDANAAAMGELMFGSAKGMKHFVLITLGTGLGSGIVEDGKVVYGNNGFAGEFGHIRVVPNGRLCACGRRGCLETYASCTGMVRSINELESINKEDSILLSIKTPTSKDIIDAYNNGDLFATEIVRFTIETLGNALADFLCFSDPQAYILFGGYARADIPLASMVKQHIEKNSLQIYKNKVDVLRSLLHDVNAAILGAATLLY